MLLFIMAFIGNSLYTLSILTNPLMGSPGYIIECLPYLLGSGASLPFPSRAQTRALIISDLIGGTLCFDVTIVLQSVVYSDKRKASQERARRRRDRYSVHAEEAAALLDGGTEDETETDGDESTTGRRSRKSSIGPSRSRSSRRTLSRKSSQSTELGVRKNSSSSRSRTRPPAISPRDPFEDRPFDFDRLPSAFADHGGLSADERERRSPYSSRGPTRASSTSSKSKLVDIREQGESSVTIRSD